MNLVEFSNWLSSTVFSQSIQITTWAIPSIQTVHILCLALLFACAIVLALRIAGKGLSCEPLPQLAARFTRAIWTLLVFLLITGLLLIIAEPGRTITNPMFYAKMIMLVTVIVITLWLTAVSKRITTPGAAHIAGACLSVLLWIGIMFAGRLIAYQGS